MTLYKEGRYYRRGNFRAVLMRERKVEAAYAARRATCGQGLGNTTSDEIVLRDTQARISPAARANSGIFRRFPGVLAPERSVVQYTS